jgi:hypothetical protein
LIDASGQAAIARQQAHPPSPRKPLGDFHASGFDHVDERNVDGFLYVRAPGVSGVAGDHQARGAGRFEAAGHGGEDRAWRGSRAGDGRIAIEHRRIAVDQHPQPILLAGRGVGRVELGQEIQRRLRTHAPQDTNHPHRRQARK